MTGLAKQAMAQSAPGSEFPLPRFENLSTPWSEAAGITLKVLRLDQIDPLISGNKWYKLRYNLELAREQGHTRLLSFGGAWSNHLYALAAAGRRFGFETIGVLRSELIEPLNPVLNFVRAQGMHLHPLSRAEYRLKDRPEIIEELHARFGDFYLIPEGGCNQQGLRGCSGLAELFPQDGRHRIIALACGTGTTFAGLLAGFAEWPPGLRPQLLGVPVLKGGGYLEQRIRQLLLDNGSIDPGNWHLETDFHCGGYARTQPVLLEAMAEMQTASALPLEHVYTGKLFHALRELTRAGRIAAGSEVIAIHTGGIHASCVENFPT